MTQSAPARVWAVCVTFDPEISVFTDLVTAVRPQVEGLIVMDNGSTGENRERILELCQQAGTGTIFLPSNQGLAAALNQGISQALSEGATDVLLLDHDSVPGAGMVAAMVAAKRMLAAKGDTVGALGAEMTDARTGRVAPFVRFSMMGLERQGCENSAEPVVLADTLNTSGSLIAAGALAVVGTMDEALFIDHVDTDWCLRAAAAGFRLYGVCGAVLTHRLGDEVLQISFPVKKSIHVHSPSRLYFFVRNSVILYRRPYAPMKWWLPDAVRLLGLAMFYCVFPHKRRDYARAIWRGLRDAARWPRAGNSHT